MLQLNLARVLLSRRESSCRPLTARPPHTLWAGVVRWKERARLGYVHSVT